MSAGQKAVNTAHVRSPSERVNAELKNWKILRKNPGVPDPSGHPHLRSSDPHVLAAMPPLLADELRPGAADAVRSLTAALGSAPALLTGDAPACAVAARLVVDDVRAGLLPADRAAVAAAHPGTVLAVGDGINEAPLLATARVGLAVGEGAGALAVQASDGVLLRDPLGSLIPLLALARRARRVAQANLAFAAAVIVGLVTWDLAGTLPLAVEVAGHELSTVLVCLNGLRLLVRPAGRCRRPRGRCPRRRRRDQLGGALRTPSPVARYALVVMAARGTRRAAGGCGAAGSTARCPARQARSGSSRGVRCRSTTHLRPRCRARRTGVDATWPAPVGGPATSSMP